MGIFFSFGFIASIVGIGMAPAGEYAMIAWGCAVGSLLLTSVGGSAAVKAEKNYQQHFKYTVMAKIVDLLFSDLRYKPEQVMQEQVFRKSKIDKTFVEPFLDYKGEDYFEGTYRGYPVSFSEIATYYNGGHTVEEGKAETSELLKGVLFNGLFFELEMPQSYQESFWGVAPQKILPFHELEFQYNTSWNTLKGELLQTKVMDGSIPIHQDVLNAVTEIANDLEEPIWVSYNNGYLYIAIATIHRYAQAGLTNKVEVHGKSSENILHLFAPLKLKIKVVDNAEILLRPMREIQSCLDIVDKILLLYNRVKPLDEK
ncbi:MAG: hypothetical protein GY810_17935 [Aureispira sp.]|nr:hypothetical protein [Aureispira sp.]